ncbi:MAG: hypothetical protein AAF727_06210 [Pseudomonadota bacterium]
MAATALIGLATQLGLPVIQKILANKIGPAGGALATDVIREVAGRVGIAEAEVVEVAENDPKQLHDAMIEVEGIAPELIQLYASGVEHQFALLQAEMREPFWYSAWRPGWMYLLMLFWLWNIVIAHMTNAIMKWALPTVDFSILLQLTGLFMALYMGGHTLKDIGKSFLGKRG